MQHAAGGAPGSRGDRLKLHADAPTSLNDRHCLRAGLHRSQQIAHSGSPAADAGRPGAALAATAFEALRPEDFEAVLALRPEIVLLGTGRRQRFPRPHLTAALARGGIGVEVMDTAAACRTYNILMSEGRRVLLAAFVQEE